MKAITLWEPWASAIRKRLKKNETRSWPTRYRGQLAIHAARRPCAREMRPLAADLARVGITKPSHLAFGCVVAVCRLADCVRSEEMAASAAPVEKLFGNYSPGRFIWVLEDIQPLAKPIPAKGAQGFFEWHAPELRACPKCSCLLDIAKAIRNDWREVCPSCQTSLFVDAEDVGEERCVWFEIDNSANPATKI